MEIHSRYVCGTRKSHWTVSWDTVSLVSPMLLMGLPSGTQKPQQSEENRLRKQKEELYIITRIIWTI